jgi:hypothetical protein
MLEAADPASSSTSDSAESQKAGRPVLLYAVITLAVLYCGSLIVLALFTSNPVVLNSVQIRTSSLVVSGTLDSSEDRGVTIKIKKIWKGEASTDTLFVRDLSAAQLKGSEVWILPLSRSRESPTDYVVTPRKDASSAVTKPLLYPADPVTLNKLKSLLSPDVPSL